MEGKLRALAFYMIFYSIWALDPTKPVEIGVDPSVIHRWWFWLVIGFIGAFFIVATFFVWRGFRNYRWYKRELQELREQEADGAAHFDIKGAPLILADAKSVELSSIAPSPSPSPDDTLPGVLPIDEAELGRRTGTAQLSRSTQLRPSLSASW